MLVGNTAKKELPPSMSLGVKDSLRKRNFCPQHLAKTLPDVSVTCSQTYMQINQHLNLHLNEAKPAKRVIRPPTFIPPWREERNGSKDEEKRWQVGPDYQSLCFLCTQFIIPLADPAKRMQSTSPNKQELPKWQQSWLRHLFCRKANERHARHLPFSSFILRS